MTQSHHKLAREFFAALASGDVPDALLTPDMTMRTLSSGLIEKKTFQGGMKLFASVFKSPPTYVIETITAEDDRVVTQGELRGVLVDGQDYVNPFAFVTHVRDGRVAACLEFNDPRLSREKLGPLIQAAMAKAGS